MHNPADFLIFWLPSGYSFDYSGDTPYELLLVRYFGDICRPNALYPVLHQYPDAKGRIGSCTFGGYWLDNSGYPGGRGSQSNPLTDADIENEVLRAMTANGWNPSNGNNLFFVYTGLNVYSCAGSSCSFSTFCAYHSYFWDGASPVIYANMPDVGTSTACQIGSSPNNDITADSEINVSSHEQFESFTDPTIGGWWYNDLGHEIGDECAYVFGSNVASLVVGNDNYVVQDEWSNDLGGCTLFECGSTGLPTLAPDVLGCSGIGPTSIGLKWGVSGYGAFFNRYEVQEEGPFSNSSWVTLATITDISATTYYVGNLSPNSTYSWRVLNYSCCLASVTSNTVKLTQRSGSVLSYSRLSSTDYQFAWNNNANYTGPVVFVAYELMESVNNDPYAVAANLTNVSVTSLTITLPSSSTSYSFYLTTTDRCNGCAGQRSSSSNSNVVGVGGPPTFIGGLFGEYWNGSFFGAPLSGCTTYSSPVTPSLPPAKTTTDPQTNFGTSTAWDWHPFGYGNEFSVKWIGGITIANNGTYSFQLASDDGSWLYLDSALVLDHGGQHSLSDSPGITSLFLARGLHQIEIDYYETCGPPSGITLSWTTPGMSGFVLVPSDVLVPPPRVDGQGIYSGACATSQSCQLLSTSNSPDVIVVVANCETSAPPFCTSITSLPTDSSGLVFTRRGSFCYNGTVFSSCLWEYYAIATSPLNNDNITWSPNQGVRWRIMILAVSGANTNSIFDSALPAGQKCSAADGSPANCTLTLATSQPSAPASYELLLATAALNDAGQCNPPAAQGWSLPIIFDGNQEAEYQIGPATQRNYSFTCNSSGDPLIIIADGIQGPAPLPDFTISASPSSVTMDPGAVGVSEITITSVNGFSGTVSFGAIGSSYLGCTLSAASVFLVDSAKTTLACSSSAALTYSETVTAAGAGRSNSVTVTFIVQDFAISAPISKSVEAGSIANFTVTVIPLNGFAGTVNLSAALSPAKGSCTFSKTFLQLNLSISGTSILSCNALGGTYSIAIAGSSGSLIHSLTATLFSEDFTLSSNSLSITSAVGSAPNSTLTLSGLGGFSGNVTLSTSILSPAPSGGGMGGGGHALEMTPMASTVTVSLNQTTILIQGTAAKSVLLTVQIPLGVVAGTYTVLVIASGGGQIHAVSLQVIVMDFSITLGAGTLTIPPGGNANSTVTMGSLNGFQGNITFSVSVSPPGVAATLSPAHVFLGPSALATSMLSVFVPSSASLGNYTVTITASYGSLTHSVTAVVVVKSGASENPLVRSILNPISLPIMMLGIVGLFALFPVVRIRTGMKSNPIRNARRLSLQSCRLPIGRVPSADPTWVWKRC